MSDDWTNIDEILRRNVEPVPMTMRHLAEMHMGYSIPFDELVLVPSRVPLCGWVMRRMPDPTSTWTSHMEGDIEE